MQKISPADLFFMQEALAISRRGAGRVHPNPLVGAVLVKKGKIIGLGAHEKFGGPHAEVNAIYSSKTNPSGATLYVTLEPCGHFGKTPPCVQLIVKKKIKKVVIAARDPNPLVAGKGMRFLKKAGVEIVLGVLEKEALDLNRDYNHWMVNKTPYVILKTAQSLDGKIATETGQSRWITGDEAREAAHELRALSDAVLVGVGTILNDNPRLNVRLPGIISQPVKIVLDSHLRTPPHAKIFLKGSGGRVILVATKKAPQKKRRLLEKKAQVILVKEKSPGRIDWKELLKALGRAGIVNLLVEGGGQAAGSAISEKIVNEVYFFMAPKIIGGDRSVNSVGGRGIRSLKQAPVLKHADVRFIGKDILVHGVL